MEVGRWRHPTTDLPHPPPTAPAYIMNDSNLSRAPPSYTACPSDGDQKETGGVYKEGKSAKDQGTSLIFSATLLCILMTHVPLKKKKKIIIHTSFFFFSLTTSIWDPNTLMFAWTWYLPFCCLALVLQKIFSKIFWNCSKTDLWPFSWLTIW